MMDSLTLKHKVESGNPHARLPAIGFHDPIESRLPLHLEPHREPISSSQLDAHDIRLCSAMRSVRRRWRGAAFVDVARDLEHGGGDSTCELGNSGAADSCRKRHGAFDEVVAKRDLDDGFDRHDLTRRLGVRQLSLRVLLGWSSAAMWEGDRC